MARTVPLKRYSVYRRKDDMPVILFGTSRQCAAALGVTNETFRCYIARQRGGERYPKKILIFEDEIDEEERADLIDPPKLTALDCKIVIAFYESGMNVSRASERIQKECKTVRYHLTKFSGVTGLSWRNRTDLEKMVQIAKERSAEDGK